MPPTTDPEAPVLLRIDGATAFLTLNRPSVRNSLNKSLFEALLGHLDELSGNKAIRAAVLSGAGSGFSAGQDLKEVTASKNLAAEVELIVRERCSKAAAALQALPFPTVCAVHGAAAGAGANLALCCDIVIAAPSAFFMQAFSRIGLIPDTAGTFFLPRAVGSAKARALFMLAEKIGAEEAERIGMIYRVVPEEALHEEAAQLAARLAALPTRALVLARKALLASHSNTFEEQLALEAKLQEEAAAGGDFREGVAAFLEKREAVFTDR